MYVRWEELFGQIIWDKSKNLVYFNDLLEPIV
jgi:hypothetical protein